MTKREQQYFNVIAGVVVFAAFMLALVMAALI